MPEEASASPAFPFGYWGTLDFQRCHYVWRDGAIDKLKISNRLGKESSDHLRFFEKTVQKRFKRVAWMLKALGDNDYKA